MGKKPDPSPMYAFFIKMMFIKLKFKINSHAMIIHAEFFPLKNIFEIIKNYKLAKKLNIDRSFLS